MGELFLSGVPSSEFQWEEKHVLQKISRLHFLSDRGLVTLLLHANESSSDVQIVPYFLKER